MASVQAIRAQRRQERLNQLQQVSQALLSDPAHQQVWLFGSYARGDWDAYSDVDLLAVAPDQAANFALQKSMEAYWGDQPFTTGPIYLGAIICLLFFIGIFYLDNKFLVLC